MRVLADRHHAGLLYSLQLLFEDRLGFELYTPVGLDWWTEGYWRFGEVFGDDRLAQQYLTVEGHNWLCAADELWVTRDVEFPDRLIRGVTLEQFRDWDDWAFTIASVQENQAGFDRAARERGARAVYQVGNRGQQVNWDLDPLVIASAEAPLLGRGVNYHQEYDKDGAFAARTLPGSSRNVIRSFVNCFDRMPEQYALFNRVRPLLEGEFDFYVHGHDGSDGLVQPTTAVADTMQRSGFAWHDKPQGDGFGHVIHYWASIGRPLIGHASYYRGLFAEHLWEDGVTCIDLGKHSPERVAEMVRDIRTDPGHHHAMCTEIRRRVDDLVDFDAEEKKIRALLSL